MEILLAEHMGMCKGLRLIIHRTKRELADAKDEAVYLYRELVHNDQAHEHLLDMGVKAQVFRPEDVPPNSRVIVGPHSAPPSVLVQLGARAKLADTSCVTVLKVLETAQSLFHEGYRVVFVGKADHEEAEMIRNAIPGSLLVSTEADIVTLPYGTPLGLVSQSTGTQERYLELARAIETSGHTTKVGMTVCQETHRRQEAVKALAQRVDKMIVIGGLRSSNSASLANTAKRCVPTWQIETAQELQTTWFQPQDRVGVTAGASTPDFVVAAIIERLQAIAAEITAHRWYDFALIVNTCRWQLARLRTFLLDRILATIEWIQYLRGRNPTDMGR